MPQGDSHSSVVLSSVFAFTFAMKDTESDVALNGKSMHLFENGDKGLHLHTAFVRISIGIAPLGRKRRFSAKNKRRDTRCLLAQFELNGCPNVSGPVAAIDSCHGHADLAAPASRKPAKQLYARQGRIENASAIRRGRSQIAFPCILGE